MRAAEGTHVKVGLDRQGRSDQHVIDANRVLCDLLGVPLGPGQPSASKW